MKNWISSLSIAFTMLTRLPLPSGNRVHYDEENIARSVLFFPAVGLFYGLVWVAALQLLNLFLNDNNLKAFVLLALPYLINKFFHLDGLADSLDAFLADRTKEERLVILKDSRIGTFALGGIVFYLLLKFLLMAKLLAQLNPLHFLIFIPVLSRYGTVFLAFISKYPRENGTGKSIIGKIKPSVFLAATLLTLLILGMGSWISGPAYILPYSSGFALTILTAFIIKLYAGGKIGGVTGDVLGASIELTELGLIALSLILIRAGVCTVF